MELHARYPHSQGRTSLSYSPCGRYLFTTGENMLVRRFLVGSPGDEPETLDLDAAGTCIRATKGRFVVANAGGSAQLYDTDAMRLVADLSRAALPVRCVDVSSDGAWAAVAGDDSCRVVNTADITKLRTVEPSDNVRHLVFHPVNAGLVAASAMDGVVRVLDLESRACVAEFESLVPSVSDFADDRSTAVVWSPSGEVFALPTKTFGIALVSASDWLIALRLTDGGHENAVTSMAWSPNGRYLASSGRDHKVLVWDVASRAVVKAYDVHGALEVAWHPHDNELSFTTSKGQLYTVNDVVTDGLLPPSGGDIVNPLPESAGLKRPGAAVRDAGDEYADDLGLGLSSDLEIGRASDEDEPEETLHARSRSFPKRSRLDTDRAASSASLSALQEPFQSGATPWLNQKRYLCMSSIGYVWSVRQSKTHNSATISFFDQSVHREVHFQDNDQFDLASLTTDACLFANSQSGKVAVRFLSSLTDNWDIDLDLEVDGGVQCVALSSEVAVVYTKSGFMRTFTSFGAPWTVVRVGGGSGRVLACAAFGNEVITIHQQSANCYTYTLEDVGQGLYHQKNDSLEVAPGARVTSAFFSEEGEPYVMDSTGVLSTLVHARVPGQARWVPVFSNTSSADLQTKHWPLGVLDSKLLCVVLRGQRQYPSLPLPITDEVELHTPGMDGLASVYLVARTQWQQLHDRIAHLEKTGVDAGEDVREELAAQEIELDKMLLRQFQAACQGQRMNRGLQVVALIRNTESLQAAAKIAMAFQLTTLAERILEAIE